MVITVLAPDADHPADVALVLADQAGDLALATPAASSAAYSCAASHRFARALAMASVWIESNSASSCLMRSMPTRTTTPWTGSNSADDERGLRRCIGIECSYRMDVFLLILAKPGVMMGIAGS